MFPDGHRSWWIAEEIGLEYEYLHVDMGGPRCAFILSFNFDLIFDPFRATSGLIWGSLVKIWLIFRRKTAAQGDG